MEKVWKYAFYRELRVFLEEQLCFLTRTSLNFAVNREKVVDILFETINAPAMWKTGYIMTICSWKS
jgi:actin beta/gamma 1